MNVFHCKSSLSVTRVACQALMLSALLAATSCIDKNYDLADIDSTMQIKVNDLVLPLNIEEVEMKSILDVEDNEVIRVIDGKYSVMKEGDFKSDPITIDAVNLSCDPIPSSSKEFHQGNEFGIPVPAYDQPLTLRVGSKGTPFHLATSAVPDCVVSIEEVGCDFLVKISMGLDGFEGHLTAFRMHDDAGIDKGYVIHLPKHLQDVRGVNTGGDYNPETGTFTVPAKTYTGSSVDLMIAVGGVNFNNKETGISFDPDTHSIIFDGELSVDLSTRITIYGKDIQGLTQMPNVVKYYTNFDIKNLAVNSFTGEFRYDLQNFDIPAVNLNGVPDLLAGDETNIILADPQLWLKIKNPLPESPVEGMLGLNIAAVRAGQQITNFPMAQDLTVRALAEASYCLSPEDKPEDKVETVLPGFESPIGHPYPGFERVLSGNGLPRALDVDVINPRLPRQHVTNFRLGRKIDGIEGKYCFYAPLQLAAGSRIVYVGTSDEWWNEDMEKLEIDHMSISAKVTTDLPIGLQFTGYPLDYNGERIEGVTVEVTDIPANAKDYPITIDINGLMKDLDGIHYVAEAEPGEKSEALKEDMKIILKDVKVKVNGSYTDSLD